MRTYIDAGAVPNRTYSAIRCVIPIAPLLSAIFLTRVAAVGLAHCNACDLKENLWLCLTCGSLGCGRQLYGGLGGNGHGLEHFKSTGHAVSVKLGTITAEGAAGESYSSLSLSTEVDPRVWLFSRYLLLQLRRREAGSGTCHTPFDFWDQRADVDQDGEEYDRATDRT